MKPSLPPETKKLSRVVMLLSNAYDPDDRVRNEALALHTEGYEVVILAWDRFGSKPKEETHNGIQVKRVQLRSGYGQSFLKFLAYGLLWVSFLFRTAALKPDVVHCHDFDTFFVGLIYSSLAQRCKFVFDAHENYAMMMKPLVPIVIYRLIRQLENKFVKQADLVISACKATASYYGEMGAKNVITVGNWKSPDAYKFSRESIESKKNAIGIDDQLVVTYIGSLTEDRNVIPLIQAVKSRSGYFLMIGGAGGQEAQIKKLAEGAANIYFPGYIHPDEVPLYTALSDIIYYGLDASDHYAPYNAPNKLFEALAAGKPILACDLGGELTSIVRLCNCGFLIKSMETTIIGDALDHLVDENYRREFADKSKSAGENQYNWRIAKQKLLSAYNLLVKE